MPVDLSVGLIGDLDVRILRSAAGAAIGQSPDTNERSASK